MRSEYFLIGRKLGHSLSAEYFNNKFNSGHISARYSLCEIPSIEDLPRLIAQTPNLKGFNVTIPYKEEIIPFLDSLTPLAKEVMAVNTVKVIPDPTAPAGYRLMGHNTDVGGFISALKPHLTAKPDGKALVLGSGGGAKAAVAGLKSLGFTPLVVSRFPKPGAIVYSDLTPELANGAGVIVNATPAGMWPHTNATPPFPFQYLRNGNQSQLPPQVAFDLVYNPEDTLFLRIARAHGAKTVNGLAMLHAQADLAWDFWNAPLQ